MEMRKAAKVTQIDVGHDRTGTTVIMLRVHFQQPGPNGKPPGRAGVTPDLCLTEQQARDLLLLLGHALGFPGTGIEPTPQH